MNDNKREPELDPELSEGLARWSEHQREEIASATRETTEEDRRRAVTVFTELAKRPRGRTSSRIWLAAAALAVAVALGWFLRGDGSDAGDIPDNQRWMGPAMDGEFVPSGEVTAYDLFRWPAAENGSGRYALRVWNSGEQSPALETTVLTKPEYAPGAEELEQLGPSIYWEVSRLDANGDVINVLGSASASRPSSR